MSTSSSGPRTPGGGFTDGGCRASDTCQNLKIKWIYEWDLNEKDVFYVHKEGDTSEARLMSVYTGNRLRMWLVPTANVDQGNARYDFIVTETHLNDPQSPPPGVEMGPAGVCMIKHAHSPNTANTGVPVRLDHFPETTEEDTGPSTTTSSGLNGSAGGVGLQYSKSYTSGSGAVVGTLAVDGNRGFFGTWTSSQKDLGGRNVCDWTDGVALESGVAYKYDAPAHPPGRNYTWGARQSHKR